MDSRKLGTSDRGFDVMTGPKSNSRKGLMYRVQMIVLEMFRDWKPHKGSWQPDLKTRAKTKRSIAALREALDQWEASL